MRADELLSQVRTAAEARWPGRDRVMISTTETPRVRVGDRVRVVLKAVRR